jgi:hypothetical protein
MKSEYKKLILAAVILLVAGGVYWFVGRSKPPLPDSVKFVCVSTGEIFSMSQKELPGALPARNPKTGERTLIPVTKAPDGKLVASRRYAHELLRNPELARVNKYVDPETLQVLKVPR